MADVDQTSHTLAENVLGFATGTVLVAFGLALLKASGAVTGGTAGLSLLLGYVGYLPFAAWFGLINLPFAIVAIWKKGVGFALRTFAGIVTVSILSEVNQRFLPLSDLGGPYVIMVGNLVCGVGLLVLFRHGTTLGGLHIIALLVQERTGFRAGWTAMAFDVLVVGLSALLMPWPSVVLSALGTVVLNLVLALNHRPGRYIGH